MPKLAPLALLLASQATAQVVVGDVLLNIWKGPVDIVHTRPDGTLVKTFTTAHSKGYCLGVTFTPDGRLLTARTLNPDGFSLFGPTGAETEFVTGLLSSAGDTAARSNGELLVVQQVPGSVEAFLTDGTHLRTYGAGTLESPFGIHVDFEDTLWVADYGGDRLFRYAADGTELLAWDLGYTPADLIRAPDGTVWTIGSDLGKVRQHASDGALLGVFNTAVSHDGSGIALALDGTLLVSSWTQAKIHRYATDGTFLETLDVPGVTSGGVLFLSVAEGSASIGDSYCGPANLNSTGAAAEIGATGTTQVSANFVELHATQLPPGELGYFLNSMTQDFVNLPPGSQGNLCLGGSIGRYVDDVLSTGAAGEVHFMLDLTDTPTGAGPVAIQPGETWNFQCWFRDKNPGPTSNFTDGVSITFD